MMILSLRWWLHDGDLPVRDIHLLSQDRFHPAISCGNHIWFRQGVTIFHLVFVYIFQFFFKSAWSALQNYMGRFRRVKVGSRQYKRRILSCRNEAFHMKLQDIICEEFVILPGSRQNGTEFHTGQAGSCNQYLKSSILAPCYRYTYWPYFF